MNPPDAAVVRKSADYKSTRKPVWCPGCGDYGVLNSIFGALAQIQLVPEKVAVVSGIGCSSRMPGFIKAYGFHGAHGRALPVAVGVKVANPELDVLVVGGDGDAFSIGGGHIAHVARRNIDLTYIVMDNEIYGLTKGQTSPTSNIGTHTKASPYGSVERPVDPISLLLAYGATYVARGFSSKPKELTAMVEAGMRHRGFSFIQVLSPCVTLQQDDRLRLLRLAGGSATRRPQDRRSVRRDALSQASRISITSASSTTSSARRIRTSCLKAADDPAQSR